MGGWMGWWEESSPKAANMWHQGRTVYDLIMISSTSRRIPRKTINLYEVKHLYMVIFCCRLALRHVTCPYKPTCTTPSQGTRVTLTSPKRKIVAACVFQCVVSSFFHDTSEGRRQKICPSPILRYSHHYLYHHQIPSLYFADISFAPMKILNQALLCWICYTSVKLVWKMATTNKDMEFVPSCTPS